MKFKLKIQKEPAREEEREIYSLVGLFALCEEFKTAIIVSGNIEKGEIIIPSESDKSP